MRSCEPKCPEPDECNQHLRPFFSKINLNLVHASISQVVSSFGVFSQQSNNVLPLAQNTELIEIGLFISERKHRRALSAENT
jgi:hypothetical protein